jgi:hypothetical protein
MVVGGKVMNLEAFLAQISNINKKYEEIYKFSGEKFNIFNLLNLAGDELSHSKIIGTLLNQKGMHGKDNKFLELFLKCIGINNFSIDNVTTETEKFIGYISDDYNSGGRIDIALTNSEKMQIFIENKIYANDQWNQLSRYNNYNPKAYLLYLTLSGNDPGENSIGKEKKIDCIKISYKDHILKWLELCRIESIDNPLLRETLTQYIVLVKQLTGQARSRKMQKEYLDTILKDADNVSAAFIISQNFNDIKIQILKEKFVPLMANLGKKHGFDLDIPLDGCFEPYWGFSFIKPEWKKFKIDFEFEGRDLQNLIYGFCGTNISQDLDKYLRDLNYKSSKAWPLYQFMDLYRYWKREFYTELYSNSYNIVNVFENKIDEISLIVENKGYEL